VTPTDLVIIDTCIWVPFFNRPQSVEKKVVDTLLDEDRAVLLGPVLAEILLGFRREDRADWVASTLRGLHYLEIQWEDWRVAARIGRRLAARKHRVPLTDLAISAVALRAGSAVYTTDPHFDLIPDLKRFGPN
jgi:predicted nucleic acid-binding protein